MMFDHDIFGDGKQPEPATISVAALRNLLE